MITKFESVKEKIIRFKNQKDCQNLPNYSILKNIEIRKISIVLIGIVCLILMTRLVYI